MCCASGLTVRFARCGPPDRRVFMRIIPGAFGDGMLEWRFPFPHGKMRSQDKQATFGFLC
jgi:hypothetical protein